MLRPVRVGRQVLFAELDSLLPMVRFLQASFGVPDNARFLGLAASQRKRLNYAR